MHFLCCGEAQADAAVAVDFNLSGSHSGSSAGHCCRHWHRYSALAKRLFEARVALRIHRRQLYAVPQHLVDAAAIIGANRGNKNQINPNMKTKHRFKRCKRNSRRCEASPPWRSRCGGCEFNGFIDAVATAPTAAAAAAASALVDGISADNAENPPQHPRRRADRELPPRSSPVARGTTRLKVSLRRANGNTSRNSVSNNSSYTQIGLKHAK